MAEPESSPAVLGRSCAGCTLCCKLAHVKELDKPRGVWCRHCDPGHGCKIHPDRPQVCRDFFCAYLTSPELSEAWKPSHSRMLLVFHRDRNTLNIMVDPQRPDAWRREPYYSDLKAHARLTAPRGEVILVSVGRQSHLILPDRDVDLGILGDDEIVLLGERMGPSGMSYTGFKLHKDDPRVQHYLASARPRQA